VTRLYDHDAALYDLAFDWDVGEEARWLRERLGPGCRSVLEPGCGSGRILEALARLGLDVEGLDRSPAMVALARARLAWAGLEGRVTLADMTEFDLGRELDGAVCPIGTLTHLTPPDLARHLEAMSRHLRPGARYLVQVALFDRSGAGPSETWESERDGAKVRVTWTVEEIDLASRVQRHRSRIEVVEGEAAGTVVEETHELTAWTPETWSAAIERSAFVWSASYDGGEGGRPPVARGAVGPLLWHELYAAV
jgi:cyclopropane fatty-acyl-phospholipid synthase-like methyltransferase